tara:strand:+ start:5423 stop:5641 length:219 start_codon:yes stop_codon:yes gene_type:complete
MIKENKKTAPQRLRELAYRGTLAGLVRETGIARSTWEAWAANKDRHLQFDRIVLSYVYEYQLSVLKYSERDL